MVWPWILLILSDYSRVLSLVHREPTYRTHKLDSLDPEWGDAIRRLEIDYDEQGRLPGRLYSTAYSYRNSWDLVGHFEVPYYAILYTNITSVETDAESGEEVVTFSNPMKPGTACGGMLVSPTQVLTTCGCLYAWWRWENYNKLTQSERRDFTAKKQIFRFTINDPLRRPPPRIPRIYLAHSQVFFNPDYSHWIDNDMSQHTSKLVTCDQWYQVNRFSAKDMQFALTIANFKPPIRDLDLNAFLPWPPVPLANVSVYNRLNKVPQDAKPPSYPAKGIRARIIGMGFVGEGIFTDDMGRFIQVSESVVDVETEVIDIKKCKDIFSDFKQIEAYLKDYMVCLKGLIRNREGFFSVKDGFPGNPVLTGFGSLAGVLIDSISISQNDHYFLMLNFGGALQYNLENDNDNYLLERQRIIRAPLYREGGWEKIFVQYTEVPDSAKYPVYFDDDPGPASSSPPNFRLYLQVFFAIFESFVVMFHAVMTRG